MICLIGLYRKEILPVQSIVDQDDDSENCKFNLAFAFVKSVLFTLKQEKCLHLLVYLVVDIAEVKHPKLHAAEVEKAVDVSDQLFASLRPCVQFVRRFKYRWEKL